MPTSAKDMSTAAPPSYEEAMHSATSPPPQIGIIYPNANVNFSIHPAPSAPPQTMQHMHSAGFVPSYGAFESTPVSVVVQQPPCAIPTEIIVIGACPACRIGYLEDSYTCLGLFCAIAFFPLGVLCCLATKAKRCTNCGTVF